MADFVNGLEIRKRLGPADWAPPTAHGPDGFQYRRKDRGAAIIVTGWQEPDNVDWVHASMSRPAGVPDYEDLTRLHQAVWPAGYAYQLFVPPSEHINIHPRVLHLWGRADGARVLPDFGKWGTI